MKRILSAAALLLAALLLALCCSACGGDTEQKTEATQPTAPEPRLAGVYRLVDGTGISSDELDRYKEKLSLEIGEDNVGAITFEEQTEPVTFNPETKTAVNSSGTVVQYTFDGVQLVIDMGEPGSQVWEKQK